MGKFNFGHIAGDPFALATISIAIVRTFQRWRGMIRGTNDGNP